MTIELHYRRPTSLEHTLRIVMYLNVNAQPDACKLFAPLYTLVLMCLISWRDEFNKIKF